MRRRYEVWSYSATWQKWIRDIYPDLESARMRYEDLLMFGGAALPPRPANLRLPVKERLGFALSRVLKRPSLGQSHNNGMRS